MIIQNCEMKDGHGGVVIGSETTGGVENVFVRNCKMNSSHLERAIRIKTNACRGGLSKNLYFKNIVADAVIKVNMYYGNEDTVGCHYLPTLDSVFIKNITSKKSGYAIFIKGREKKPVKDIYISNCTFENVEEDNVIKEVENLIIKNSAVKG